MGAFQRLIAKMSEEELSTLNRTDMGVFSLTEEIALIRLVRAELEAAEGLSYEEIPKGVRDSVLSDRFANEVESVVERMRLYGPGVATPNEERNEIADQVGYLRDVVLEKVRPLVRTRGATAEDVLRQASTELAAAQTKFEALAAEHEDVLAAFRAQQEALSLQQASLAASSAETVAADLSPHYAGQATKHGKDAKGMLIASGVVGVLFAVATALALFKYPPEYTATGSSEQWIEFVRGTVGRLTLLSLGALALAFCLRNYRVNRHLEVVNKRGENALKTFGLLQAAVTTDEARSVVVAELVRSVFGSEETGYLTGQGDRTVIEGPGGSGILSAMTAAHRGGGSAS